MQATCALITSEAVDLFINCVECGRKFPEEWGKTGCRQCYLESKSSKLGKVCKICATRLAKCQDCTNMFCQKHISPDNHARAFSKKMSDTCAKHTRSLKWVSHVAAVEISRGTLADI